MQIPVNKDLDSYKDDFFKGLTLKQTAISIVSVAAGCGMYLIGTYIFHLEQSASFYLALPVVLPIAASGFLKIHGMTPVEYFKRRRSALRRDLYVFIPDALLADREEATGETRKTTDFLLDDPETREVM